MEKENLDLKTAIQIAKIVVTVPEERMPIIWDIFKQAGLGPLYRKMINHTRPIWQTHQKMIYKLDISF